MLLIKTSRWKIQHLLVAMLSTLKWQEKEVRNLKVKNVSWISVKLTISRYFTVYLKKMNTGFFVKVTDVVADVMLTSDRFRFDLKHVLLYLASIYNVKVLFV